MSLTDFLFDGSAPTATTSLGSTSSGLPDWFSQYLQGTVAKANTIAAEPFQQYTGPRLAPLSADQNRAYGNIEASAGANQPTYDQAGNMIQQGAGASSIGAAQPLINRASALSPTGAAQPLINQASGTFPGAVNDYMSPYTQNVTDRIAQLGTRNLTENILPGLQDQFVAAGQSGSRRAGEFANRAVRDTQDSVLGAQANALESGYQTAGNLFNADQNRAAGLASTAGSLAGTEMGNLGNLGQLTGNLTAETANRGITGGSALASNATAAQGAGLRDNAALEAAGQAQQQNQQQNLDLAHSDFVEQRDYPKTQTEWLNSIMRGMQPGTNSSTTTTQQTPGTSPLAQIAGAGTGIAGLLSAFKARGGRVNYARGGRMAPLSVGAC